MSTQKHKPQREPEVDFGFHAVVPRCIRTGYKQLNPIQKWLYVCLKDLCGDHGTCYRTLRVLSQETGISTGMLSESIPLLHQLGLIHAEKKSRSTGGKATWHITIVDIWQANAKEHPTKRSQHEQTSGNVHHVNDNVHSVNDNTQECSQHEQECSQGETEAIPGSNTISEGIEGEAKEDPPTFSPLSKEEVFQVYDTYMGFVTVRSRDNLEGAELLSKAGKTAQQIIAALEAIENDPDHFDWNRISLKVLSDRIDARQKRVHRKRTQADYGKPPPQVAPETTRGKPGEPLAATGETSPPPQTAQEIVASIAERVNAAGGKTTERKEHTHHV